MADFDQELDASGLNCPLPILRAKKTLNAMASGQVLHVIATDPGSVKDFDCLRQADWQRTDRVQGRGRQVPLPDQEVLIPESPVPPDRIHLHFA